MVSWWMGVAHRGQAAFAGALLAAAVATMALALGPARADRGAAATQDAQTSTASAPSAAMAADLDRRLAAQGLTRGAPVLLRIFKEESELELWMQAGDRYRHFASYKICRWRGSLGPKLTEGDRQSPEGFYSFGQDQLLWQGHWFRAFNINYPNTLDRELGHTGSGILIHGACSSIGCYAMTDPVIDEIFDLIVAAFAAGQPRVQVHIFPFHMTFANLARHEKSPWIEFWRDLKPASDLFVSTQVPPRIGVCDGRYVVRPAQAGIGSDPRIRDWCGPVPWAGSADRLATVLQDRYASASPVSSVLTPKLPSNRVVLYAKLSRDGQIPKPKPLPAQPYSFGPSPEIASDDTTSPLSGLPEPERAALLGTRAGVPVAVTAEPNDPSRVGAAKTATYVCNTGLASCRHFIAQSASRHVAVRLGKNKLAKR